MGFAIRLVLPVSLTLLLIPLALFADVLFETPPGNTTLGGFSAGSPRVFTQQAVFPASDFTCDTLPNWTIDEIDFRLGKNGIGAGEYQAALWFSNATGTPDIVSTNTITIGSFAPVATRTAMFARVNIREACHTYSRGGISRGGRAPHLMFWGVVGISGTGHEQGYAAVNHMGAFAPAVYAANSTFVADNWTFTTQVRGAVEPECTENCFSNVLFLPGVKGSRLVSGSDTLWPPTVWSDDVPQLALDEEGESVNTIKVDGILNDFCVTLICTPIYAPFSDFLESLVSNGTINEWHPFAYDWRYSPQRIVDESVQTTAGMVNLVETVEALAARSKSGKVVIVAHSMGGLVGKALIKKLELEGQADLIESLVMVGTPQLGTPQAIASMLHGDEEGILGGFIVNPSHARTLARNLPSAHVLLPSQKYFEAVPESIVRFSETASFTEPWRAVWGSFINSFNPLFEFLAGQGAPRARPTEDLLRVPEVLSPDRLSDAANFHAEYDSYVYPENIRVVHIAGWGRPTVKAIEYRDEHGVPSYRTNFTVEGDGTVVYPSAAPSGSTEERYFFDLFDSNRVLGSNIQHRDLLSAISTQQFISSVTRNEAPTATDFFSSTKPEVVEIGDGLVVSTHSPVILGAFDSLGNFTGVTQDQDLSAEVLSVREGIPGSAFVASSESQYLFLPKNGTYRFVYRGIENGSTTVEIQSLINDIASTTAVFSDLPTSPETKASFDVNPSTETEVLIVLDTNGDGVADEAIEPDGSEPSLTELLASLKAKVVMLSIADALKQSVLKRIAAIEKKIEKRKKQNAKILASIGRDISRLETQERITSADAADLLTLITELEALSDEVALDGEVLSALRMKVESLTLAKGIKNSLLKRITALEQKRALTKDLESLEKNIAKKAAQGEVGDADAQEILALLEKIEKAL